MRTSAEYPRAWRVGASMIDRPDVVRRAQEYCKRAHLELGSMLGFGLNGIVYKAENQSKAGHSAVKSHERRPAYRQERNVYQRLSEEGVKSVVDCAVPKLLGFDDELWVIEMSVVTSPFVLDFASAYLDEPPDRSDEMMAAEQEMQKELFEDDWPKVQAIVRGLERYGVYFLDISPRNISLRAPDSP